MTIYFVQAGDDGPIKIGFTAGPVAERLADVQVGCPWKLNLLGTFDGGRQLELALHLLLTRYRMEGEWFTAGPAVDQVFAKLKSNSFDPSAIDTSCFAAHRKWLGAPFEAARLVIELPRDLSDTVEAIAAEAGLDTRDLVIDALRDAFGSVEPPATWSGVFPSAGQEDRSAA